MNYPDDKATTQMTGWAPTGAQLAWERCTKGSCHRHQACMYHPCRAVAVGADTTPRYSETDVEIETRTRAEMADNQPTKLRVLGPYEIAALLRQLDRERADAK
jgi:hypothetical protein